ncbi:MAG: hypothetical protein E7399_09540 [Ruminococcaceae bacterium]|nr:hypothetical protein [Oscillospiraceae bacterium]
MARTSKKVYQGVKKKKQRNTSLYERYALMLIPSLLYIVLGAFQQVPFFVFQALFLMEGIAFFQDAVRSSLRYSNIATGVLFLCWVWVSAMRTGLTTGYTVSIGNQVIFCNLIYVAILGILIYQIHQKRELYYHSALSVFCIVLCIVSIVLILGLLFMVYLLQLSEALDLEQTDFLIRVLTISAKLLPVVRYPVAEWLLHGSILCSILMQSNQKYGKSRRAGKKNKKMETENVK